MTNSDDVPLCGEQIFMYPGDPGGMGILDYTQDDYRDNFSSVHFIDRQHILAALEDEVETRDVDLFNELEEARFKIPDYQRHYSWDDEDHQRLWHKLLQITQLELTPGPNPPENFFGTIYVGELQERKRYEVIDGQQRLTTISIVLECIRRKFDELIPDLSGDLQNLAIHIQEGWIEELLLRQRGMNEVPFLQVSSHDHDFFEILFSDTDRKKLEKVYELTGYDGRRRYASTLEEVISTLGIRDEVVDDYDAIEDDDDLTDSYVYFAESHQLLVEAFDYYEKEVDTFVEDGERFPSRENTAHALINLALFVLRSFRISEILFTGENKELRVNVFQELNDAGKPLTTKDKIKARIVSLFQQSSSYSVEEELDTWSDIVERFADKSDQVEEFLVTYVQATRNPDGAKHARENLLDLFRLTDVGGHEFTPQLTSDNHGHEFLQELDRYSERYVEIEDLSLEGGTHGLDRNVRKRSEEIIRRLTDLNTTQWIPFMLYLYDDVSSTPGKDEFFEDVLRTIETLIFRVSLSEVRTTVVESTFMESAAEFRERKDRDDINEPYDAEAVSEIILDNVEENRQLNGETLVDTIVRSRGWGNKRAKQLFLKIVDEHFGEEDGMTRRDIDEDVSVDIEHVLPEGFIRRDSSSDPYVWLNDFFATSTSDVLDDDSNVVELIRYLERNDAANISEGDEAYDRVERIISYIDSDFVSDLGNMIILEGGLNRSIQNKRFSIKLHAYHEKHPEDIENAVNEFFSTNNPELTQDAIDELLDVDIPSGYDDTNPTLGRIEVELNGWWNLDRMVDRKVELVSLILRSLTYNIDEPEYLEEFEDFLINPQILEEIVVEDMRKRTEQVV